MSLHAWVDPRIQQARAESVRQYLLDRGWRLEPFPRTELWVFGGLVDDDGQPVIQVLPSSEKMVDFRLRLEELVGALSVMEDRPAQAILEDILRLQASGPPALPGASDLAPAPK